VFAWEGGELLRDANAGYDIEPAMTNTLYYSPGACSLAAHIVLEEIGEPYDAKVVSLKTGDNKKPEFTAVNPRGKVPTIKTDGGVLTENAAILSFLADTHAAAKLFPAPTAGLERAHALEYLAFLTSTVHTSFGPLFGASRIVEGEAAQKQLIDFAKKNIDRWFSDIDASLKGKAYALGEHFSVIDPYLFVFWRWATGMKLDVSKFEAYQAHAERMKGRPAVQRVLKAEGLN
jgi:glutathione S-transferase